MGNLHVRVIFDQGKENKKSVTAFPSKLARERQSPPETFKLFASSLVIIIPTSAQIVSTNTNLLTIMIMNLFLEKKIFQVMF